MMRIKDLQLQQYPKANLSLREIPDYLTLTPYSFPKAELGKSNKLTHY